MKSSESIHKYTVIETDLIAFKNNENTNLLWVKWHLLCLNNKMVYGKVRPNYSSLWRGLEYIYVAISWEKGKIHQYVIVITIIMKTIPQHSSTHLCPGTICMKDLPKTD